MLLIAYSVLYDKYVDLSKVILTEIGSKLGNKEYRINKIYFSRFIMITINYLVREVVIDMEDDKLNCWTQSKRIFQDLVRINMNSGIELAYPLFVQVCQSSQATMCLLKKVYRLIRNSAHLYWLPPKRVSILKKVPNQGHRTRVMTQTKHHHNQKCLK